MLIFNYNNQRLSETKAKEQNLMNYLKNLAKVKLGLTNPYIIKEQFKLLTPQNPSAKVYLQEKFQVNYDSHILRLRFQDEDKVLGRKIGQYIQLEMDTVRRKYVPISRIDSVGFLDLLVRDMSAIIGPHIFSKKLVDAEIGKRMTIFGPHTQYLYNGYGKFEDKQTNKIKKYRYIAILTQQTAITTTYSLIQSVASNFDNQTCVSLLWMADKIQNFVLLEEIMEFQERKKLLSTLLLTKPDKQWRGPYGKLTQQHIKQYLPPPSEDTVVIISGSELQKNYFKQCVEKAGHQQIIFV